MINANDLNMPLPSSDKRQRALQRNYSRTKPRLFFHFLPRFNNQFQRLENSSILIFFLALILLLLIFTIANIATDSPPSSRLPATISLIHRNSPLEDAPLQPNQYASSGSIAHLQHLLIQISPDPDENHQMSTANPPKLIVILAVNYAYRHLALNFICNLRRLHLSNYLVLAMDSSVYQFLRTNGANVFHHVVNTSPGRRLLSQPDDPNLFGTASFLETSRRKSMLVQTVLQLGYSVVFSDVDVVWLKNPIPILIQHSEDFVLQSDTAYPKTDPLNFNVNSGFYLVRSNVRTVTTLKAIVKYSAAIRRSEQKAFNYVLCGAFKEDVGGPGKREGSDRCRYRRAGTTARVLSLQSFPNGSDPSFWNGTKPHLDAVVVHANYVEGRLRKIERIRKLGFWFFDEDAGGLGNNACRTTAQ